MSCVQTHRRTSRVPTRTPRCHGKDPMRNTVLLVQVWDLDVLPARDGEVLDEQLDRLVLAGRQVGRSGDTLLRVLPQCRLILLLTFRCQMPLRVTPCALPSSNDWAARVCQSTRSCPVVETSRRFPGAECPPGSPRAGGASRRRAAGGSQRWAPARIQLSLCAERAREGRATRIEQLPLSADELWLPIQTSIRLVGSVSSNPGTDGGGQAAQRSPKGASLRSHPRRVRGECTRRSSGSGVQALRHGVLEQLLLLVLVPRRQVNLCRAAAAGMLRLPRLVAAMRVRRHWLRSSTQR